MTQKLVKLGLAIVLALGVVSCDRDKEETLPPYELSEDGKTLTRWIDKNTTSIDMTTGELARVEHIADGVFRGMYLTDVKLPTKLRTIGVQSFSHNRLASIELPNTVTSVGRGAFQDNVLTTLIIQDGGDSSNPLRLGVSSFYNNILQKVDLPNKIISISISAFSSNTIKELIIRSTTPPSIVPADIGYDSSLIIYVPESSLNLYRMSSWRYVVPAERIQAIQ